MRQAGLMWTLLLPLLVSVPETPLATIDHVILATADLEQGIAELERRTGVRPQMGGAHPGRGTRNALMSLGDGVYLELIAPDPAQPADLPAARRLRATEGLTPDGWALTPTSLEALQKRYATTAIALTPPFGGSRVRPDGRRIGWQIIAFQADERRTEPFFIKWDDMALHPSRTAPPGCTLGGIALRDVATAKLVERLRPLGLAVPITTGAAPALELRLRCPTGEVVFR